MSSISKFGVTKTQGLYILSSDVSTLNVNKFGMSMRLEYRWKDYQYPNVQNYCSPFSLMSSNTTLNTQRCQS